MKQFANILCLTTTLSNIFIKLIQKNLLEKNVKEYLKKQKSDGKCDYRAVCNMIYQRETLSICPFINVLKVCPCCHCQIRINKTDHFYTIVFTKQYHYPIHKKCLSDFMSIVNYRIIDLALPIFNEQFHKLFLFSLLENLPLVKDVYHLICHLYYLV